MAPWNGISETEERPLGNRRCQFPFCMNGFQILSQDKRGEQILSRAHNSEVVWGWFMQPAALKGRQNAGNDGDLVRSKVKWLAVGGRGKEYADFEQISMFHPPHYHTSVVPFKNYVSSPPYSLPTMEYKPTGTDFPTMVTRKEEDHAK